MTAPKRAERGWMDVYMPEEEEEAPQAPEAPEPDEIGKKDDDNNDDHGHGPAFEGLLREIVAS